MLKVREIIRMQSVTLVPQMPDYVKGVINLRGKVIPLVDLRLKFRLTRAEINERTCIVVVQVKMASGNLAMIGMVVDSVEEVIQIPATEVQATPDFGPGFASDYILGMARIKGAVKTLLDIEKVLAAETLNLPPAPAE